MEEYENAARIFMETGEATSKIAKKLGVKAWKLNIFIKEKYNVDIKAYSRKKLNEKYEKIYQEFTVSDEPLNKIAKRYHISQKNLSNYISQRAEILGLNDNIVYNLKYKVNENAFSVINTEEKAYWLGFIMADGYNSGDHLQVTISQNDYNHLKKLRSFLKADNMIYHRPKDHTVNLTVSSQKICLDLAAVGCVKGKTYCQGFPCYSSMHPRLWRHFVRGYIDGDGCLTQVIYQDVTSVNSIARKMEKIGIAIKMKKTAEAMQKAIKVMTGGVAFPSLYHDTNGGKDQYELYVEGQTAVRTFLDCMYKEATVYLDRKYKRYLQYILPSDLEIDQIINAKLNGNVLPDLYPEEEEIHRIIRTEGAQYELDYGNIVDRRKSSQGQSVGAETSESGV